jgi:hypothetical protein
VVVTQPLRRALRGSKDAALAFGARTYFNNRLRRIGELTELSIDTKKRALEVRLDLLGEAAPIAIHVNKYDLKQRGTATTLMIVEATASREWLAEALREFVIGRSFKLPASAGAVLKLLT